MFERNIDFKINNQATLAKLIMFNRRRGDEAERITVQSIILLIETTNRAGVNPKNPYVFARSSFDSVNPIRSWIVLENYQENVALQKLQI